MKYNFLGGSIENLDILFELENVFAGIFCQMHSALMCFHIDIHKNEALLAAVKCFFDILFYKSIFSYKPQITIPRSYEEY